MATKPTPTDTAQPKEQPAPAAVAPLPPHGGRWLLDPATNTLTPAPADEPAREGKG